MKIFIENSRLSIQSINPMTDGRIALGKNKKQMNHQLVALVKNSCPEEMCFTSSAGIDEVKPGFKVDEAYILLNENKKSGKQSYNQDERNIIMRMLVGELQNEKYSVAEELVLSLKDTGITDLFYSDYGDDMLSLRTKLVEAIQNPRYTFIPDTRDHPKIYDRGRYSIYHLLNDLVDDKGSEVCVDRDLIGEYKRISLSKTTSTTVTHKYDSWGKVLKVLGNVTRANLNLSFMSQVEVDIPANNFGIKQGPTLYPTIRSINVIKDGIRNLDYIGVKVGKKLAHKLKAVGCISIELFRDNEFVLDLKKLPVISKPEIKTYEPWALAELEVKRVISHIAVTYYNTITKQKQQNNINQSTQTLEEAFLSTLGICGGYYYPTKEKVVKEGRTYQTTLLNSEVDSLYNKGSYNKKLPANIIKYNAGNPCMFKDIFDYIVSKNLTIDEWRKIEQESSETLQDRKFKIIMSKNLKSGKSDITSKWYSVTVDPKLTISVKWKLNKSNITV